MKLIMRITTVLYKTAPMLAIMMLLASCGSEEQVATTSPPAYVEGVYNSLATRAVSNQTLTSFSMYCFDEWNEYTGEMLADNILYSYDTGTKKWSGNRAFFMSDWAAMYGYGVSPNIEVTTAPVFTQPEQAFTYSDPAEKGILLKVASKHYFTKESTNNSLMLTFNDALYTLRFQAFSGFEGVEVEVKGIAIHNIPNKARFTFSSSVESAGSWALTADNQYVSSSKELTSAVPVTAIDFADVQDEPFVLFPFQPAEWDYYGLYGAPETFAEAKANNRCYVEVKMRIKEVKDGQTYYQWGYADDDPQGREPFESAFYPYMQFNCTAEWQMRFNGYYYLFLDDNCVDVNGNKMVPHPESGGSTMFSVSSQVDFRTKVQEHGGTADKWDEDNEQSSLSISM